MSVDTRLHAQCVSCGRLTDRGAKATLHEVVGFERDRSQGGTNHLLFRKRTGRVMCSRCAHTRQLTGSAEQEALL